MLVIDETWEEYKGIKIGHQIRRESRSGGQYLEYTIRIQAEGFFDQRIII